jgi:methionine-rich copper-binding protein CopC
MHRPTIVCAALLVLAAAVLDPSLAHAHAFLVHASPRVGSTVHDSPDAVVLVFTEPVEPNFSRVDLFDAHDQRIETGPAEQSKDDQLRVSLPPLPPGEYTVRWKVTSVDTHQTEGQFAFTLTAP